jgi:hypothetical protein
MTYYDKNGARTPAQSGFGMEQLNTQGENHKVFLMNANLCYMLHNLLVWYGIIYSYGFSGITSYLTSSLWPWYV